MEKITLVGGGLAGSLMSIFLAKAGFEVHVFERRPDMRKNKIAAGRSINLALSVRGINALSKVGLSEEVLADAIPMYGRTMHSIAGETKYQPYGKDEQAIYSVSRGRLNILLLELADAYPNIHLYFNHRCTQVDLDSRTCTFSDENGVEKVVSADRIIGSDGAFAATRGRMQMGDRFNYSQYYLEHGYKELEIPAGENGKFLLDKNSLHIWPRGNYMMIALPNPAGDFTCTLFFPFEGEESFEALKTPQQVEDFFKKVFPDAYELMPTLIDDYFKNPTASLVTVKCYPWVKEDKLALIGDAAHAIVPFYGQGMNCAFEDCVVLNECIEQHSGNWHEIFESYQKARKINGDAIADLAIQNFTEMRDKVGDLNFLERKRIEHELSELYPQYFKSQYELVTFSNTPYSLALQQGALNDALIDAIMSENINVSEAEVILPLLKKYKNLAI
jgi:kynurenine 3-monooxygenase